MINPDYQFQINTAIGYYHRRAERALGMGSESKLEQAYKILHDELKEIYNGNPQYDPETEGEKAFNRAHPEANP